MKNDSFEDNKSEKYQELIDSIVVDSIRINEHVANMKKYRKTARLALLTTYGILSLIMVKFLLENDWNIIASMNAFATISMPISLKVILSIVSIVMIYKNINTSTFEINKKSKLQIFIHHLYFFIPVTFLTYVIVNLLGQIH